ncbi:MAG: AAA family ATPase [Candidatus Hydrogenedentes bacterium]|nr:AAA family ATPase [Candidatus Hydrogenedentota bacterium]
MPITELRLSGYRSIRDVLLDLGQVNVITGPNGSGKSNLYRALHLLAKAADGTLAQAITEEGGIPSVMWAGSRKKGTQRVRLGVTVDGWDYDLEFGASAPADANPFFILDPAIKREQLHFREGGRSRIVFLDRDYSSVSVRDESGRMASYRGQLNPNETALSTIRDPHQFPELSAMRERLLAWRFYHQFRTDDQSPLRRPRASMQTPILGHDGADLAAALITIQFYGNHAAMNAAIQRAFPGAKLVIDGDPRTLVAGLEMPGVLRPLLAHELSDGTLRYLCLLAALLSQHPPTLLALNEPETSLHPSLHPSLLEPLAELIASAGQRTQVWVTTHAAPLAEYIAKYSGEATITLEQVQGETRIQGQGLLRLPRK